MRKVPVPERWLAAVAAVGFAAAWVPTAAAADFRALCEANQVYDTGKQTTDEERQLCRCVQRRFDPARQAVAIQVFEKVLAARREGLGLHPSQLDLDELVTLMAFADSLQACADHRKVSAAFPARSHRTGTLTAVRLR